MQTEEQKIDKRTKEYKELVKLQAEEPFKSDPTDILKINAILMDRVILQDVVSSWTGEPEREFYDPSKTKPGSKLSRHAKIYYGPNNVLIIQQTKTKGKKHRIIIPTAMVKSAYLYE